MSSPGRPKRKATDKDRGVRLNLDMPVRTKKRLEKLRDDTDAGSMATVIRDMIAAYEVLIESVASGGVVYIQYPDGDRERITLTSGKVHARPFHRKKSATKQRQSRSTPAKASR